MRAARKTGRFGKRSPSKSATVSGLASSIPGRVASLALPLVVAVAVAVAVAASPAPVSAQDGAGPDPMEVELWQQLEILVVSVLDDDTAALDQATCLADLVQVQLEREEALGLVPDAFEATLVEARRAQARERATTYVLELIETGDQVEAIDISRIQAFDASEPTESLATEGPRSLPITASGIIGVDLLDLPRRIDLSVYRLGADRWCFDPLSMPGE
ncbi:MAG: hypothetical protein AAGF23_05330 [Acidobacteriota bacterium]